jgi:hypothetical protein
VRLRSRDISVRGLHLRLLSSHQGAGEETPLASSLVAHAALI